MLELCYLRNVERAHGLPRGERQVPAIGIAGRIYRDVEYKTYRTVVELDGRAAHPESDRWRDMRRDNASVVAGRWVLRYGPSDIHEPRVGWHSRQSRCFRPTAGRALRSGAAEATA